MIFSSILCFLSLNSGYEIAFKNIYTCCQVHFLYHKLFITDGFYFILDKLFCTALQNYLFFAIFTTQALTAEVRFCLVSVYCRVSCC